MFDKGKKVIKNILNIKQQVKGCIDVLNPNEFKGWFYDPNQSTKAVEVTLMQDETVLANCMASDFREDLKNAGLGSGNLGFHVHSKQKGFKKLTALKSLDGLRLILNGKQVEISNYLGADSSIVLPDEVIDERQELNIEPQNALFYFPDYTSNNHYQTQLYTSFEGDWTVNSGNILDAIHFQASHPNVKVVFHLHWVSPILAGNDLKLAETQATKFLQWLKKFQAIGGMVIWTIHNAISHDNAGEDWLHLEKMFRSQLAETVDKIHLHSETAIPIIKQFYEIDARKVLLIPHGHYREIYTNELTKIQAREILEIPETAKVFAFIGQLRPYKGLEELIMAFQQLSTLHQDVYLIIAGKPLAPYRNDEVSRITKNIPRVIVREYFIEDAELQLFYNASDFVVNPYKNILTSGSVLNTLSFLKPAIAPAIGMIPEVVIEGKTGYLYQQNDADALLEAMQKALKAGKKSVESFESEIKAVLEPLGWAGISNRLLEAVSKEKSSENKAKIQILQDEIEVELRANYKHHKKADSIAVIILNYEHLDDTKRAVNSIKDSDYEAIDVFVVDNNSPNSSFKSLCDALPEATVIGAPENLGYAGGNNLGLRFCADLNYAFCFVLNPDAEIKPDTISQLLSRAKENPDVAIHGPLVLYGNNKDKVQFAGAKIQLKPIMNIKQLYAGEYLSKVPKASFETDYVSGAALFLNSSAIEKYGLIPEQYFLYYEETHWCTAIRKAGGKLMMHPEIQLFHHKRSEEGALPSTYYMYYYVRGTLLYANAFFEGDINLVLAKLTKEFIEPWLNKIDSRNEFLKPLAEAVFEKAVEDGLQNISGKFDLASFVADSMPNHLKQWAGSGAIDEVKGSKLEGWAISADKPWMPAEVALFIDGVPIANALANIKRADIKQIGIGDGCYGFEIHLPKKYANNKHHNIDVCFANSGRKIAESKSIYLGRASSKFKAYLEKPKVHSISGWAWDETFPHEPLAIGVFVNGELIDEVIAADFREDLQHAGIRDGYAAFTAILPSDVAFGGEYLFEIKEKSSGVLIEKKQVKWTSPAKKINFLGSSYEDFKLWSFGNFSIPVQAEGDTFLKVERLLCDVKLALLKVHQHETSEDLVSVIMPAFNRSDVIDDAINSVLAQTYENWELIVADDGSEDNLLEHLSQNYSEYFENGKLKYFKFHQNKGVSAARNLALKHSQGKYISYLDSDNQWKPEFLQIMLGELKRNSAYEAAYCAQEITYRRKVENLNILELAGIRATAFNPAIIENHNFIDLNVFFHTRKLYENLGGFNEHMRRLVDWELILRYTYSKAPLFVPAVLNTYCFGKAANQISFTESFGESHSSLQSTLKNLSEQNHLSKTSDTKQSCLMLITLYLNNEDDLLSKLIQIKQFASHQDLIVLAECNDEQSAIIGKVLGKDSKIDLIFTSAGDEVIMEGFTNELANILEARWQESPLILTSQNILLNKNLPAEYIKALADNDDAGIVFGRRTIEAKNKNYDKKKHLAKGALDYDLNLETTYFRFSRYQNLNGKIRLESKKVPHFCAIYNPKVKSAVISALQGSVNMNEFQYRISSVIEAIHERKIYYLPTLRSFDVSYND